MKIDEFVISYTDKHGFKWYRVFGGYVVVGERQVALIYPCSGYRKPQWKKFDRERN